MQRLSFFRRKWQKLDTHLPSIVKDCAENTAYEPFGQKAQRSVLLNQTRLMRQPQQKKFPGLVGLGEHKKEATHA